MSARESKEQQAYMEGAVAALLSRGPVGHGRPMSVRALVADIAPIVNAACGPGCTGCERQLTERVRAAVQRLRRRGCLASPPGTGMWTLTAAGQEWVSGSIAAFNAGGER